MHGGNAAIGIASATFKTGRYSKHLPTRMAARYRDAQRDTELLVLRDDVALLDARLADVLGRVDSGESGRAWSGLKTAYDAMLDANRAGDTGAMRAALLEVGDLIRDGAADWAAWAEVRSLLQDRRRLVESERKRLVDTQQMITTERAMVLLGAVVDTVRRHVTDRAALVAISTELGALVDIGSRSAPSAD